MVTAEPVVNELDGMVPGASAPVYRTPPAARTPAAATDAEARLALDQFIQAQAINTRRHVAALRPFRRDEFGDGAAAPTEPYIRAANGLIRQLQLQLVRLANRLSRAADRARQSPDPAALAVLLAHKDLSTQWVKDVEQVWSFYFELFGQRQSRYGGWLVGIDRIALDCYQAVYTGLGAPRPVPSPPPFSFMATGFTPSTFRRGVMLTRIGRRANPFPIVQLPYHRLVNPWTLGAVHHEVSHNLQNDLGLWNVVPRRIFARLQAAGLPAGVARMWARWNKEIWADLSALLLGGPAIVPSLIDVVAMAPRNAMSYNPDGVHPVPYVRVLINLELLRRMGFGQAAASYEQMWRRIYPSPRAGTIPRAVLDTFDRANALVVDTICFQPYGELGHKSLAQVTCFTPSHQAMTEQAGARLAEGVDPGIVPPRFLVGAARVAIERKLAPSSQITANFYQALLRR